MPALEYLTTKQVADELGVSTTMVVAMVRSGNMPALRSGNGEMTFERAIFERWIREQYADTRRWVLEHQSRGTHPPWRGDWKD